MTSSSNSSTDLTMDTLSLTLTNTRVIDGLIFAANSAKLSPEAYAEWLLTKDGHRFADANSYGIVTSAGFFARFTPTEYADVLAASVDTVVVPEPIGGVPTAEEQQMYDDAVAAIRVSTAHGSAGDLGDGLAVRESYQQSWRQR